MKTVFFIGLLAALAVASHDSPHIEDNSLHLAHSSLASDEQKTLVEEIRKFSRQLFSQALDMKNFGCIDCFPFDLHGFDVVNLRAVKTVLQHHYGSLYDRLIKEPHDIPDYRPHYDSIQKMQIVVDLEKILTRWNDQLTAVETISWNWVESVLHSHKALWYYYFTRFDAKKHREARRRLHYVFAPVFNETATGESFSRSQKSDTQSLPHITHQAESAYSIPPKKQLEDQIIKFLRRMFIYVFNLHPERGYDSMTYGMVKLLNGLSQRTLMIFYKDLEDDFGKVMREIPNTLPAYEESYEKMKTRDSLRKLIRSTLTTWKDDISLLLDEKYKYSWINNGYEGLLEQHATNLREFLNLEEVREVLRKATAILSIATNGTIGSEFSTYT